MHRSSTICSALALALAGCGGQHAAGGFAPPQLSATGVAADRSAGVSQRLQPDTFPVSRNSIRMPVRIRPSLPTPRGTWRGTSSSPAAIPTDVALFGFHETTHVFTTFYLPHSDSEPPDALALSSNGGEMWFAIPDASTVGYMNLGSEEFQQFQVPTQHAGIEGIAAGPDHAMWFTEADAGKVGRISTISHHISEYTLPTPNHPVGITLGSDGALWFANGHAISRISTNGHESDYSIGNNYANAVTTGPDGAIWFTGQSDHNGGLLGRIDLSTHVRKVVKYGAGDGGNAGIVTRGSDLWVTAQQANTIDHYDPASNTIYRRSLPHGYTRPRGIALGADHQLWFTNDGPSESATGKLCPTRPSSQCMTSP